MFTSCKVLQPFWGNTTQTMVTVCRQNKYSPYIRVLNSKINTVFLLEKMIAKSRNKLETHNMKWSKIRLAYDSFTAYFIY